MTTVASIILDAYRETNLIPLGTEPTQDQIDEAFRRLSNIVSSVLGFEAGENFYAFPLGTNEIEAPRGYPWWANELPGNVFLPTNIRVMCNLTAPGLINLHPRPHDGARMGIVDVSENFDHNPLTINGNGRSIEGQASMTYNTPGEVREWFYREDLGNWVTVIPLDPNGDMPFPVEFDDMFITMLAARLNPRYGQALADLSKAALERAKTQFSGRYKQSDTQMPSEDGLLYMTNWYRFYGRFDHSQYGDPADFFNSGYPF